MTTIFQSPSNPLAAMWASAVESYACIENPGMPVQQVRRLPMMQGLYEHLNHLKNKKRVQPPPVSSSAPGDDEAWTIARNAWLSQEYLNLAVTTAAFASLAEDPVNGPEMYTAYIDKVNAYNENADPPIADYSSADIRGFALCLIIWLGMVGLNNVGPMEHKVLHYLEDQLPVDQNTKDLVTAFVQKMSRNDYSIQYRDASDYPDYKAIPWTIPAGAQVVMLGDWGTGLDDAHEFLFYLWKQAFLNNPYGEIVFIHLGDIYYCGLPYECKNYFYDVFQAAGAKLQTLYGSKFNANPPIFTLPGNHEYYSLGYGYFELLDSLNQNMPNISPAQLQQQCSFFCLRTADGNWQFLGMDTGQADGNGLHSALQSIEGWALAKLNEKLDDVASWLTWSEEMASQLYEDIVGPFQPTLRPNELTWMQDRIDEFNGKTILLSHHQLFSREAKINHATPEFINTWLNQNFSSYYKSNIAAWYWGHEHTFAVYLDGLMGLNKGRLLGSSSYEATENDDTPYAGNYPMMRFDPQIMDPLPIKNYNGLLYHAGAIFAQSATDATQMVANYYQFPAWSQLETTPPVAKELLFINSENITTSFKSLHQNWAGNAPISQDKVTTDYAPSLTAWNDMLYMLYADGTTKHTELTLCTANAGDIADYKSFWSKPVHVLVDGAPKVAHGSPAIIAIDEMLYGFYLDGNANIEAICCATTGDLTQWSSFGGVNATVTGLAVCFFQGCIYIVYQQSGSKKLYWVYYDIATATWQDLGEITDTNGDHIKSAVAPALCTNGYHIYMIYTDDDSTDIRWAQGVPSSLKPSSSVNSISWTDLGEVETTSNNGLTNPDTGVGMTMCYGSGDFFMVYASTNSNLTLCALTGATKNDAGTWVGKNTINPVTSTSGSTSTAQTSQCPAMAVTSGGGFLVYRGATHDEIYWAYY